MKTKTKTPADPSPSGSVPRLVLLAWQAVETSKGTMFLDVHREDAEPVILAAIQKAQDWGMDEMRIVRTAIEAVFDAHEERLRDCMSDAVNTQRAKAMKKAGCSW